MHAVDLHVHTSASADGSITAATIEQLFTKNTLSTIAITDHNTIAAATELRQQFGEKIIVGEEILTNEGEIIGLYLTSAIAPHQTIMQTVAAIKAQRGLVYVPHPFDRRRRHGVSAATLAAIAPQVDIIEAYNGRDVLHRHSSQLVQWAKTHHVAAASSSDAHGPHGWGRTASLVSATPQRETLCDLLTTATFRTKHVGLLGLAYPTLNRWRGHRG